jgi:hypothetical protein
LKIKAIDLKDYIFSRNPRFCIAKIYYVVDVIQLAVELVFGLHKVVGS